MQHVGRCRTWKDVLKSTRTTDRATAERILAKHVADMALRREGVIDATKDRFRSEGGRLLAKHIESTSATVDTSGSPTITWTKSNGISCGWSTRLKSRSSLDSLPSRLNGTWCR